MFALLFEGAKPCAMGDTKWQTFFPCELNGLKGNVAAPQPVYRLRVDEPNWTCLVRNVVCISRTINSSSGIPLTSSSHPSIHSIHPLFNITLRLSTLDGSTFNVRVVERSGHYRIEASYSDRSLESEGRSSSIICSKITSRKICRAIRELQPKAAQ